MGHYVITQKDIDDKAREFDVNFNTFFKTEAGRKNFLDMLINEALLQNDADDKNISQSPDYQTQIGQFKTWQAQALEDFERRTKRQLLINKLEAEGKISVSEEEVQAYYRRYSYQIYLRHILLNDPEKAGVLTRELKKRNVNTFIEHARTSSLDPFTKQAGGQLPPFIPGEYLPEIEVAAANTPINQVQGFFKTAHGFHIILKTKEEKLSYNEAKDRIKAILEKQKMDAYLNTLKDKYGVEVL